MESSRFLPFLPLLVFAVKNFLNTIPSLNDKISEVENLTTQFSPLSNITENIKKIKELIELARDAANKVRRLSVRSVRLKLQCLAV